MLRVDAPELATYVTEPYAQAIYQIIRDNKPSIVLIGATTIGRDLGPRLSARVETGLTADCTGLEISEERDLLMTRPAFGGNLMATIICKEHRPQMSTVRPGVLRMGQRNAEGFDMLRTMANTIGAEVSASRAMVDAGVLGHERQVGQTGKTVRPDLYFAMGISGAIQHLAGMEESEYIIAINKDKFAPIFNVADLGIVGDVRKIVPLLTEKLKR